MITNDKEIIWMEKYRPQRIEDLVLPDHYINSFKEYIKNPRNILLTSETPGTGKTSISNAIIKEGQFECLFINASLDNGIDTLRGKIRQFASSIAFNDKCKLVVLDECLEENEEVLLVNNKTEYYLPLKDLEFGKKYKCKSYNMEKNIIEYDTCELISEKEEEVFEVELEDGRKVLVTDNHPFIVRENEKITEKKILDGLKIGDDVVCRDDIINEEEYFKIGGYNYLKKYKINSLEDFYLKSKNLKEPPKCLFCEKNAKFKNFKEGYLKTCSYKNHKNERIKLGIENKENKNEKFTYYVSQNIEKYKDIVFPYFEEFFNQVITKKSFKSRITDKSILKYEEKCPYCGDKIKSNVLDKRECKKPSCVEYKNSIFKEILSFQEFQEMKKFLKGKSIEYIRGIISLYRSLNSENRKSFLQNNLIFFENKILTRKQQNHDFSFIKNNIIENDMKNTCKGCGKEYLKYDKIVKNDKIQLKQIGAEFSCGNKECYYKSIKFYDRDPLILEKQSQRLKEKIKNGEWTPKVTNSWFNRKNSDLYKTDNISFRSSWELYFYIYNKNRNISLEYEKVIIPYFDTKKNKNRNYLVDFIDRKNNILYEIKPNSEKQKEQIKNKEFALKNYCKKNNLSFKYISEDWFKENYDEIEFSNYQLDFKDKILKLLSQFRRNNENSIY